jgi:hypothetical protein
MNAENYCSHPTCPVKMLNRRQFLAATGALAVAASGCSDLGVFNRASAMMDAQGAAIPSLPKARIRAAFARPDTDKYWMGWPGAAYDIKARQAQYTKTLADAANAQGINLELVNEPLCDEKTVSAFLEKLNTDRPDGVLVTTMCLHHEHRNFWSHVNTLAKNKGEVPMIIFSPMGTSFTQEIHGTRYVDVRKPGVFVGATQDVEWLGTGLKMLAAVQKMKNTRLLILQGNAVSERKLDVIGTTLHYIPESRLPEELKNIETSPEVKAMADYYSRKAVKIVEPTRQDILNAARNYMAARRLMAAENCHGISVNCLPLVENRRIPCGPCLAWSRLNDEGSVGACESDWNAAISLRLTSLLFDRPGFMQDPAPNTVNNTLNGAHCSCPTRLAGIGEAPEPFILRSHAESDIGTVTQVIWRIGQPVTIMKFEGPKKIIIGTGTVVGNINTPPSGGCRTSVEVKLDNVPDAADTRGFHQLFIYGHLENQFKAYCQLAGIKVETLYQPRVETTA